MRTAKKFHNGARGWSAMVTTDDGTKLLVELIRGDRRRRDSFGRPSYDWTARVHDSGRKRRYDTVGRTSDTAQYLARRALHFWRGQE